jgi:hypothetical protein
MNGTPHLPSASYLLGIPDGTAKTRGIAVGTEVANAPRVPQQLSKGSASDTV